MSTVFVGGPNGLLALQEQPYGWEVWERTDPEWARRRVNELAVIPGGTTVAATDAGLWSTDNAGVSWHKLLDGDAINVRTCPNGATSLFAVLYPGSVWRSGDAGRHWEQHGPIAPIGRCLGRDSAHGGGPLPSLTGRLADFTVACAPGGPMYAATEDGGIYRSGDGGASWSACRGDLPTTVIHRLVVHPVAPDMVFAATDFGLYRSVRQGDSWELLDVGAGARYTGALVFLARGTLHEPPALLAGICEVDPPGWSAAPSGARCRLYRSTDDGASWHVVDAGLPPWFTAPVSAFGSQVDDPDCACLGTADGRTYLSRDRGATWTQIGDELGVITSLLLLPEG